MRTTITRSAVALAAASVIGLTGCADADEDTGDTEDTADTADTRTVTETSETTDISEEAVTGGAPPEQQELPAEPPAEKELPMEPVGSVVTIAGQPATVCIYGDGWGTNIWAGNANTSCEFVSATHEAVVEGLNATTQNIREFLPPAGPGDQPGHRRDLRHGLRSSR